MKQVCYAIFLAIVLGPSGFAEEGPQDLDGLLKLEVLVQPISDARASEVAGSVSAARKPRVTRVNMDAIRVGRDMSLTVGGETHDVRFRSAQDFGNSHIWRGEIENRGRVEFSVTGATIVGKFTIDRQPHLLLPVGESGNHVMVEDSGVKSDRKRLLRHFDVSEEKAFARHQRFSALMGRSNINLKVRNKTSHLHRVMEVNRG